MTFEEKLRNDLLFVYEQNGEYIYKEMIKHSTFIVEELDRHFSTINYRLLVIINRKTYSLFYNKINDLLDSLKRNYYSRSNSRYAIQDIEIEPSNDVYLDWAAIKSYETRKSLLQKVKDEKSLLLSSIGLSFERFTDYEESHAYLVKIFDILGHKYSNNLNTVSDVDNFLRNAGYGSGSWGLRTTAINDLYKPILDLLMQFDSEDELVAYIDDDFKVIESNIKLIKSFYESATDSLEFKAIGNMIRDTMITLGNHYYGRIHGEIGKYKPDDFMSKLIEVVNTYLPGQTNDEYVDFIKKSKQLINKIVHSHGITKPHLSIAINGVLYLINTLNQCELIYSTSLPF